MIYIVLPSLGRPSQNLHFMGSWSRMKPMNITINGSPKQLNDGVNLEALVRDLCVNPAHVIAELNGTIIAAPERPNTKIKDGDRLELVTFVGGG